MSKPTTEAITGPLLFQADITKGMVLTLGGGGGRKESDT